MSSNVKVSGIPSHLKLGRLIPLFSNILSMRSSDFLMRILATKGPVNDILLSLPSYSDAQSAQEKLDNFVYKYDKITYVFNAEMHGGYNQNTNKPLSKSKFKNQNKQSYGRRQEEEYYRDRSRSPHYKDKSSELDMQLEILRKQRMILEEERKLLEEQKKLDELKRKSFGNQSPSVKRNRNEDVERCEQSSNSSTNQSESKQPTFHQACEVLVGKMKVFVRKHSSQEEHTALLTHLRSIIKERLTKVDGADGQGFYPTSKVIKLYRSQYPPSEDEELVKQALEDVKEGRANSTGIVQAYSKGGNAKNKPDVTESAAGNSNDSKNVKDNAEEKVEKKFDEKRLYFFKSSGALMKRMRDLINEYSTPETRKNLMEYLRYTLKQRLAAVVGGQPIYQTHKIIHMYREKHPPEDDQVLIKQLAKDIEEGRMPEEVMLKDKQKKVNQASDEHESSTFDNTTPEDKILTVEEVTDKSGPPEIKEGEDVSGIAENEENTEKNIDSKTMQPAPENQHDEKSKEECTIEVGPEVKNADKSNDNKEVASSNDIVGDNIGKDPENTCDNNIMGNNIKTDVLATEANEKCSDNVKVNEDNHGVKRKTEEEENICTKLAKTDDVAVISCENASNKELGNEN